MKSVSINDLLVATQGQWVGGSATSIDFRTIGIDSRTICADELFWAVKGEHHDGHDFVDDAIHRGAIACVVHDQAVVKRGQPAIIVPDTLMALGQFARWYRDQQDALVIGVTGSVGKTTTRDMIYAVLNARHSGVRSRKNFNNQIGLPLSILDIDTHHEFAVVEMGASRVGDIRELCDIAAPEIGVVTRIGLAHLEGFGSEAEIVRGKGELVEAIPSSGFVVLCGDDPHAHELAKRSRARTIFVGEGRNNQLRATTVLTEANRIRFNVDGDSYEITATGRHHLAAALAAIAIAKEIGLHTDEIARGLLAFDPVAGRCRYEQIGPWGVIDDSYNANPSSMEAACHVLRDWDCTGNKLLIVGDMLELGNLSAQCHRELGRQAAASDIDYLVALGEQSEMVVRGARENGMDTHRLAQCENIDSLLMVLDCWIGPGDLLLVKGSRGMRMERVLEWLREQKESKVTQHTARVPSRACA